MHKRGLCRHAVCMCVSVYLSRSWIMSKRINIFSKFVSPSGSHTTLVFFHKTGWRYSDGNPLNGGVECRWGRQKSRFWTYISASVLVAFGKFGKLVPAVIALQQASVVNRVAGGARTASVGIAGRGWGAGSTSQLMSATPLVVLLCLSWGSETSPPPRSQLQTLICHHIPQVIEPCHCCQAYVPYPQSYSYCVCTVIIQLQYHISIIKLSRSVIVHTCTVTVLLCYWNGNKIAVLL